MKDIVILSNGPGEVATWVRPVVKCLRQQLGNNIRISVVLSPCPHSTGEEAAIALSYSEVDRVLPPSNFYRFLVLGKTVDNWQWHRQGIVVFLGGDQFYTVAISKRLNYSSLVYAEWDARWYRFIDRFAAMSPKVLAKVPKSYHHKFSVVGDLMADVALEVQNKSTALEAKPPIIGLLVGSKPAKLFQGVPLCLAIAQEIEQRLPETEFIIPVAPTLNPSTLNKYANVPNNPLVSALGNVEGKLLDLDRTPYLVTSGGTKIKLITQFPAYQELSECKICLTTVGANTAELASLGIPMIVLLPTQQLDAMRSWDGLPGILANLPGVGTILAKLINWLVLKQNRLFAWPNIWAGKQIVPELVGKLQPKDVANLVMEYLNNPIQLKSMRDSLAAVRGESGAAKRIADIIDREIT